MFLFNRSDFSSQHTRNTSRGSEQVSRPLSRQATPSPSLSTSTGEWSPQRRDGSKRSSVFGTRQRSNTIASSSSLTSTASSIVSVEKRSWLSSPKAPSVGRAMFMNGEKSERSESMTKSLLSRSSRLLKRQNSTLTSLRTLDGTDGLNRRGEGYEVQELAGRSHLQHERCQLIDGETRKQTISEPYNFQHLTHAHAKQLPELGKASQNEIVTEFSAIRASQAPRRELRGIKAENLHFRNFSSETLQQDISNSCFIAPTTPPPSLSPTRSTELLRRNAPSPLPSSNGPRQARSVENFSLPGPKSPRSPQSPIVPPPRTSSRAAMTIAFTSPSACLESPTSPVFGRALIGSPNFSSDRHESAVFLSSNGASTDQTGLPHAVTTPDDSALHLLPLPFGTTGTELADVPEEDESYFRKRSSKQSSRASTAGAALRHSQSFPSNKSCRDGPISHQSMQEIFEVPVQDRRPTSNASNTLGTPFVLEPAANRSSSFVSSRRLSRNLKGIEGDWEDDIDYCYEHEAEADCDFDWDRKSREYGDEKGFPERSDDIQYRAEAFSSRNGHILQEKSVAGRTRNNFYSEDLGRISVSSIDFTIPDLEPASALSTSTSGLDALTPSLSLVSPRASQVHVRASKGSDGFIHSPSLLVPSDYETQMLEEAMYQEMLADGASGDHHYSFYNRIGEAPDSRTDSPLSKCNSQESMAVSRSASAMHTHRSTDSSGSLPELIHSKNSREKFERVADQLAEHIAALNTVEAAIDGHRSISPPYKRRFSPAKEPTHQSMLKKATCNASAEDTEAPAPVVQSMRLRDRSCSDDTVKAGSSSSNCTSASVMAKRIRSSSTATTASGRRSSRVSYTLFPASTLR